MDKNFAGQNLNGRSFREQDLRGADFSACQLKGCDFTNADLTGAKFCRAILGVDGRRKLAQWLAAVVLGIFSGFLTWFLNFVFTLAVNEIYKTFTGTDAPIEENDTLLWIGSLYAASICLSVLAALKYRDWRIVTGYFLVIIIGLALGLALAIAEAEAVAGAGAVAAAGAGAGMGPVALALVGALALAVALGVVAALLAVAGAGTGPGPVALAAMTAIYLLLGWYLNRRSLQSEEPMLALLRRYALVWRCWGGTQFYGAVLAYTDFAEADLTAARFVGAKFQQPNFTHAKNLHLAWTYASPLERKPVRALLTEGRLGKR